MLKVFTSGEMVSLGRIVSYKCSACTDDLQILVVLSQTEVGHSIVQKQAESCISCIRLFLITTHLTGKKNTITGKLT